MQNKKALIVNDDGILASGLQELALAVQQVLPVAICAPFKEQSACGTHMTLSKPLGAKQVKNVNLPDQAWAVDGYAVDAVAFALNYAYKDQIGIVLSGVNGGFNTGDDAWISGTVAAATYSYKHSLPSIAVSVEHGHSENEKYAAHLAALFAKQILDGKLGQNILLNINYPSTEPQHIKGIMLCACAQNTHQDTIDIVQLNGRSFYWLSRQEEKELSSGSDVYAVRNGYISIAVLSHELWNNTMPAEIRTVINSVWQEFCQSLDN